MNLKVLLWSTFFVCAVFACVGEVTYSTNMYTLEVHPNYSRDLLRHLQDLNLTKLYQVTPSTFILNYTGHLNRSELLSTMSTAKKQYTDQMIEIEPSREYIDDLRPENVQEKYYRTYISNSNLVCDNYYGMGVPDAWAEGYSGRGVSIAVTDVGINTEINDLKDNINTSASYNFVDETRNVTPEFFYKLKEKTSYHTDHGNMVASVIAAIKGNDICSAGIAYNARITVLKIYKVKLFKERYIELEPSHWTTSSIISRALVYGMEFIDIFANAWAPIRRFEALDLATRNALQHSAVNGRRRLGTIHVVPSGPPGNELSNNIYTVTVNSIGKHGTVPAYVHIDASVLTSGLGEGNNLTASFMVTTTLRDRCVTSFKGVSVVVSEIAAIIALALEENKNLSLRDIQHLLVHSSDREGLQEKAAFRSNSAGNYFHDKFGFGLINAGRFVKLAAKRQTSQPLLESTRTETNRQTTGHLLEVKFCHTCNRWRKDECLTTTEHVVVKMNLESTSGNIKVTLKSPTGTESVLMDLEENSSVSVKKLKLVSVHFWDEIPLGFWSLIVEDKQTSGTEVTNISLSLFGTNYKPTADVINLYTDKCGPLKNSNESKGRSMTSEHTDGIVVLSDRPSYESKGQSMTSEHTDSNVVLSEVQSTSSELVQGYIALFATFFILAFVIITSYFCR